MKMTQLLRSAPYRLRLSSVTLIGLLALHGSAFGGEHTDFPDLSIKPPSNGPRLPRVPSQGPNRPTVYDLVSFVDDGELGGNSNSMMNPPMFPAPTPQQPTFIPTMGGDSTVVPGGYSAVPSPGAGGLMLLSLTLLGRRRR